MKSEKLPDHIENELAQFTFNVRRGKFAGSCALSVETMNFVRKLVAGKNDKTGKRNWETFSDVLDLLQAAGKRLNELLSGEVVVTNTIGRVLKLIRDEEKQLTSGEENMRTAMIETIKEYCQEMETISEDITAQGSDHLGYENEVILTMGYSKTVAQFIGNAVSKENNKIEQINLFVVDNGRNSRKMCEELKSLKCVRTKIIDLKSVHAHIGAVTKIIFNARAVFKNGSVLLPSGCLNIVAEAKWFRKPVIVLAASYKVSSMIVSDETRPAICGIGNPHDLMDYTEELGMHGSVTVLKAKFDLIPSEYVDVIVSDVCCVNPRNISKVLLETSDPLDEQF